MPKLYPLRLSKEMIKALRKGATIGDLHRLRCGVDTPLGNIKFESSDVAELAVYEVLRWHFENGNILPPKNTHRWREYISGDLLANEDLSDEEFDKIWAKLMDTRVSVLAKRVTHPTYFDI